jgi:hypothetical protein
VPQRPCKIVTYIAAGLVLIVLSAVVQSAIDGHMIAERPLVMLLMAAGFVGNAAVMMFVGRKVVETLTLTEGSRAAEYMRGVRDTIAETGGASNVRRMPTTPGIS